MVIIFKLDMNMMNIIEEKGHQPLCASTPSPFSVTHQRHQLQTSSTTSTLLTTFISASVENPRTIIGLWSSSIRTQVSSTAAMLIHLRGLIALLSCHLRLAVRTRMSLGTHLISRPRSSDASTETSPEELPFPMASQPRRHLCGHLHHLEEADPHFHQSSVGIIHFCIVDQLFHNISGTPQHPHPAREGPLQHLGHLHHRVQHLWELETHQRCFSSTSRRENQQLDDMVIKEEEVDIKTRNDREVITTKIIKIIMQEYPGNSSHIMSDNFQEHQEIHHC